jgi:hypothetical protein
MRVVEDRSGCYRELIPTDITVVIVSILYGAGSFGRSATRTFLSFRPSVTLKISPAFVLITLVFFYQINQINIHDGDLL